ncbi:hypothetical protein PF008_g16269 [Phytophthora fragariae]|uniref:EGF-like domain-containing protein n=1 Tax=Phytophthora fragariae TaxID=53985 RepID=A0A6G0RBN4_9STRA|nr:hypothetical protein PF008_g16269 [Phytophthora fragariae]
MRLHYVATLPVLFCVAATADSGSHSGSGPDSNNAGYDAKVEYLPVDSLQHELLNTTGLVPDSLVAVTASYGILKDESPGLAGVTAPNTNVYASVLIVPGNGSATTTTTASNAHEAASADELSGRTQLMYNCTPAPNLWNLQEDPNVLKLETFQQVSSNASSFNSASGNDTGLREIVAFASVEVSNCATVQKTAVGRPVLGNAFFSAEFSSSPVFFYTTNSTSLSSDSASGSCLIRLEMAQANFTEVYPNCKIALRSTDFDNIIQSDAVPAEANKTRRLDLGSYDFVKDPTCSYECGAYYAAPDECLVDLGNGQYATTKCQLQFYEQNPNCDNECGDAVGDLAALPANQCYQCESDLYIFDDSCDYGYARASLVSCCTTLPCAPSADTTVGAPTGLTWNLQSDGESIADPSYLIYEDGDCSDPHDLSSTCCRITCEECFVSLSIASFYVDLDANDVDDYSTTAEMKLTGKSYLRVKVFAPNGCTIEATKNIINLTARQPLYLGLSVEVNVQLDIMRKLNLKPHGTSAQFGASTEIQGITVGYIDSEQFADVRMITTPSNSLGQNGIDIEVEVAAIPSVTASLSMLAGIAKIGVKTTYSLFAKLQAGVEFPEPYPGLSSQYLVPDSEEHYGDCSQPHFMQYAGYAGYKDFSVSMPMKFGVNGLWTTTYEPKLDLGLSYSKSLFSGCVASAYDAEMLLSTAITTVSSLSDEKQEKLKKIVMWVLGIAEIDPDFLSINHVSADTGEISITIAVPPSVAENYPKASDLQQVIYQRARTADFSNAVTAYVGLGVNAKCDSGSWGQDCESKCVLGNCGKATCNPVDGATISCAYCASGYWGPTCEESCDVPSNCVSAWCQQGSETAFGCWTCQDGWEGDLCETSTSTPSPSSPTNGDTSSSTSSGSTSDSTPTPTPATNANTGTGTSSACTWAPLLWLQVFISASGLIWLL